MSNPLDLFRWFLPLIPVVAVWLVGAILAFVTWRKHPTVSMLTLIGCLILIASSLGGNALQYWVIHQQANQGWSGYQVGWALSILGTIRMFLNAVAYVLLFCAIFGWRSQATPRLGDDPWPRPKPEINPYGEINRGPSEDVQNRPPY